MALDYDDLPDGLEDRILLVQNILIERATGEGDDHEAYEFLRSELMREKEIRELIPSMVKNSRSLGQFWGFIKPQSSTYAGRREIIWESFRPLFDFIEGANQTPADDTISDTLATFDEEGVHTVWKKALSRREDDPDGAITSARTLLETVCKRILDESGTTYTDKEDLPKLYSKVAELLNLAPSQHTEVVFKTILGNCHSIVSSLGSLRNKIGDAHGHGGPPVRAAPRHAAMAVNLAGSVATFLVETWQDREQTK